MSLSVIKPEHKDKLVAFGGGGKKTLGERDDIDKLAIIAHESQDPSLLSLFEKLPPLEDLKKAKTDSDLKITQPALTQNNDRGNSNAQTK